MQINSGNQMSFGCGACASAYKNTKQLFKIPGSVEASLTEEKALKMTKTAIGVGQWLNPQKTHGEIASEYNKFLGERIKKLSINA